MMTHAELDALAPKLQAEINTRIAAEWPSWSRYAVDQEVDRIMEEMAPSWQWILAGTINGAQRIALTQYNGPVESVRENRP